MAKILWLIVLAVIVASFYLYLSPRQFYDEDVEGLTVNDIPGQESTYAVNDGEPEDSPAPNPYQEDNVR